ncbi:hypothetical protein J4437_07110 [Candidatus Woesearchaeota archaeon]|nr:hypothetical protein [Candidatus Woesearchaeota archaeon]
MEEDGKSLKSLGYKRVFTQKKIINPEIKQPLFSKFSNYHDLSFFKSDDGPNIELLNWKNERSNQSNFGPLLILGIDNQYLQLIGDKILTTDIDTAKNDMSISEVISEVIHKRDKSLNNKAILIKTNRLQESIIFWELFGFKIYSQSDRVIIMSNEVIISKNYNLKLCLLEVNKINKNPHLDDTGISCISFLSTNILKDKKMLFENKIHFIEIGCISINKKNLEIIFAQGKNGELVEIIEFK